MARHGRRDAGLAAVAVAVAVSACGDGSGSASCGPARREALDPAFLVHVVDGEEVAYTSDPPTSGPHQPSPAVDGALDAPIAPAVQVGILERGDVLIQHDPGLPPADQATLRGLAGGRVVVAPNPSLPAAVVATAWVFKLSCQRVDPDALRAFTTDHAGKGPDG